MSKPSVLFIFTSADKLLNGHPTGWYLPEAAHPYYVLTPDVAVDAASPKGGKPPVDQSSVEMFTDKESVDFLKNDPKAIEFWSNTKKISEVKAADYDAIFVVGGHGPMIDLWQDKDLIKLTEEFYAAKKPVAAVCHGPAAFVQVKTPSGDSIYKGAKVTAFGNAEEEQTTFAKYPEVLPWSLEDKMRELSEGGFEPAEPWQSKVHWSKGVLTGQNPASAGDLGKKLKEILLGA